MDMWIDAYLDRYLAAASSGTRIMGSQQDPHSEALSELASQPCSDGDERCKASMNVGTRSRNLCFYIASFTRILS